jgi:glycine/D-amino acid oxidase-like deaminating enzyme
MDLRSHYPYSLLKNGLISDYSSVHKNISTDVLIIGAGITGSLIAWHLAKEGIPVIVVDKRHVGLGSTAASTSLLQYEIDTPLVDLQKMVGKSHASRSYLLCKNAIDGLGVITNEVDGDVHFAKQPSFQFASFKSHMRKLEDEYKARKAIGIELDLLDEKEVAKRFNMSKPGGLLSKDGAQLDAYLLTHALLQQVKRAGNHVYDHSPVTNIRYMKRGVEAMVMEKYRIRSKTLIIACGYESQSYLPKKVERLASTYAVISERFNQSEFWYRNALIWETGMPYLYMKVTYDNRIVVGGKDVPFYDPFKRDALLPSKGKQLQESFKKLFPSIDFKIDFRWTGTFSNTKDGLPYVGSVPGQPRTYFALGFGGNGITFSQIASQLIRDHLLGKKNPDMDLFSFNR